MSKNVKKGSNSKHDVRYRDRRSNDRREATKDSSSKRVNFDNARESKVEKDIKEWKKTGVSNDVRWYAHNPEMLRAAATIPFSNYTGQQFPWFKPNTTGGMRTIPGIMVIDWTPQLGGTDYVALNQAAKSMYSFVVHANSRNKSYDAPDLMMMVLAGSMIFSGLAAGIRAYGVMRNFNQENSYTPAGLVAAMGFNYSDLKNNLSKMWFDINELVARSKQVWIPNTMPLTERWYWMNSNVYMDSASVKDQMYLFKQIKYLKLSETGSTSGTSLISTTNGTTKQWGTSAVTWEVYIKMMNEMFDAYLDSQDRGIISGDVLKAYGPDKIYAASPITADYTVVPTYDMEVLTQISNATLVPGVVVDSIVQDPNNGNMSAEYGFVDPSRGYVDTIPASSDAPRFVMPDYMWLNFKTTTLPTPEMVMVATRMSALGNTRVKIKGTTNYMNMAMTCGSESMLSVRIYYFNANNKLNTEYICYFYSGNISQSIGTISLYSVFDWRPPYIVMDSGVTNDFTTTTQPTGNYIDAINQEIEYGTPVYMDVLKKMHTTAIFSLFGIPAM